MRVLIVDGGASRFYSHASLTTRYTSEAESAVLRVARALSADHRVTIAQPMGGRHWAPVVLQGTRFVSTESELRAFSEPYELIVSVDHPRFAIDSVAMAESRTRTILWSQRAGQYSGGDVTEFLERGGRSVVTRSLERAGDDRELMDQLWRDRGERGRVVRIANPIPDALVPFPDLAIADRFGVVVGPDADATKVADAVRDLAAKSPRANIVVLHRGRDLGELLQASVESASLLDCSRESVFVRELRGLEGVLDLGPETTPMSDLERTFAAAVGAPLISRGRLGACVASARGAGSLGAPDVVGIRVCPTDAREAPLVPTVAPESRLGFVAAAWRRVIAEAVD